MPKTAIKNMTADECAAELEQLRLADAASIADIKAARIQAHRLSILQHGWMRRSIPLERRRRDIAAGLPVSEGEAAAVAALWDKVYARFELRISQVNAQYKRIRKAEADIAKGHRRMKNVGNRLRSLKRAA